MGRIDEALRKSQGDEEKRENVKGAIPADPNQALETYGFPIADFTDPKSPLAESYRALRTNIQRSGRVRSIKSILVTSAGKGEGRTQTVANLAVITSAIEGHRTLLIDADLRKPELHKIFQVAQSPGLSNFLQGAVELNEVIQPTLIGNLKVIPSGDLLRSAAELFHSPRLKGMMETLTSQYDMVFFDSPPVIPFTDSAVLSSHVDGIILVVKARGTRKEVAGRAKDLLNKSDEKLLGVVFNQVEYVIPQPLYQKL